MPPHPERYPNGICVFRLSAIGDVAHTVAVVRALQDAFPAAPITWIVGRVEAAVASLVLGVEIVAVDKRHPVREAFRLRRTLRQRFDALLHMQVSVRSNVMSLGVRAAKRWGFDRARSKEGHSLVINRRIPPAPSPGEHVLTGLMRFASALGAPPSQPRWDLAIPDEARAWAAQHLPKDRRVLAVNVCASRPVKDWTADRFARVLGHAIDRHGLHVVLCGGRSEHERRMAADIVSTLGRPLQSLVGETTLPQLLAVLERSVALLSPDSGPVHLATAVGTPSIGLYGATNINRCGPSLERRWSVYTREAAALRFAGKASTQLGWSEVVPGGMDLIEPDAVCERLDALFALEG